jgi:hypothetical protein
MVIAGALTGAAVSGASAQAMAADPAVAQGPSDATAPAEASTRVDPTGGAYASPTLLFTPAGAVPAWNARIIASSEVQTPADVHATFRPGLGAELGLPAGITLGGGTNWVGGDVNRSTGARDFSMGISPYAQARLHILGAADGQGFQLGTSATYKVVGFEGNPGEIELAASAQYRTPRYELGLQAGMGKDLEGEDADAEVHAYALYRFIPELGLGAAGQTRIALATDADAAEKSSYDVVGGALASLTLGRYQLGALAGGSTLGLAQGRAGALGQFFATARF